MVYQCADLEDLQKKLGEAGEKLVKNKLKCRAKHCFKKMI